MSAPRESALYEFALWEPLLRLIRASNTAELAAPGGYVRGHVGVGSWSVPVHRPSPPRGQAAQVEDMQEEWDAVHAVIGALTEAEVGQVEFVLECGADGATTLRLYGPHPHVEPGFGGPQGGSLLLVDDAVPEPWRRLPELMPDAMPAPTADPVELARMLRERLPDVIGATEEEIAATESRIGVTLPGELRSLYGVVRGRWEDWSDDFDAADRVYETVGCELLPLDHVYVADASTRPAPWEFGATDAAVTRPGDAVQGVVGSPGWIVFGGSGGGDGIALDLTPGPAGHLGQVVLLSHEEHVGAELLADSLTDLVRDGEREERRSRREELPEVARVNHSAVRSVEAAAHPALEVLSLGVCDGEPFSLAPVVGLPRLRTLSAYPGTLADPREIGALTGLEYLDLPPDHWRSLLDAGAVPRGLLAASIEPNGTRERHHPLDLVALANEILALFGRSPITPTVLEGYLGPSPTGPARML
ncbi:SMI1/KNR4 family protein [Streptomyces acidiscabies]|uniref:Bifunctional protein n=1 Tax=Streptomyces acidiscabies TaxID=42234 RepID=A0A0L0JV64_9ACTN|nr:SMI1/KNR4 family protein [Streptomyces acidiscabies]KND29647.1 bifunctional protein [Streptomyces acidiscabies]